MQTIVFKLTVEDRQSADIALEDLCQFMDNRGGCVTELHARKATRKEEREFKRDQKRE
jgi:hypothetical protein